MDYKEAYKELIKTIDIAILGQYEGSETKKVLENIKAISLDSEDERIRKWIANYIHTGVFSEDEHPMALKAIEWLEKQKEQKPWKVGANAYFTPEQKPTGSISQLSVQGDGVYKICPHCKERMVRDDSKVYTSIPPKYGYNCPKCGAMEFDTVIYDNPEMEEQKPAEWSEEDEEWLDYFERLLEFGYNKDPHNLGKLCFAGKMWLKSLRPQPHWKPSEERMKALQDSIDLDKTVFRRGKLISLLEDLKKL